MEMESYKLTHAQKRIWYLNTINSGSNLNNIGGVLKIVGNLKAELLEKSFNILKQKNDSFRLRFIEKDGEVLQYIEDYKYEKIDFLDFSNTESPKEELEKWERSMFDKSFEFIDKRLYYFAIYKLNKNEYGYLINAHHIICDGWTFSLFENELSIIYGRLLENNYDFSDIGYSYINYIKNEEEYFESKKVEKSKQFWLNKFQDIPEYNLYNSTRTLEGKRVSYKFDKQMSEKIINFTNEYISLDTLFLAGLLVYLNKRLNKQDLIVGFPVYNRTGRMFKNMTGMCTSTVPFRFDINGETTVSEFLKDINNEKLNYLKNQKYPYDLLLHDLDLNKKIEQNDSLFKYTLNCYNSQYCGKMGNLVTEVNEFYCGNQSYSLQIIVKKLLDNIIEVDIDYKVEEYIHDEINTIHNCLKNIVKQIIDSEIKIVDEIQLMDEKEKEFKLFNLNNTDYSYTEKTIYELFEEQVEQTPNEIALEFKNEKLTYLELNEKANQLSKYLMTNGVGLNSTVAVLETHSLELIISILAVLKARATYVPIDPEYQENRIQYIIEDSKCSLILTNIDLKILTQSKVIDIRMLDYSSYGKENETNVNTLNDLAYILYTSGSTGKPKGVMVEHRGLTNYILWANRMYIKSKDDSMALYSSISFDLTVTSMFTPLMTGNKIVIYNNDESEFVIYRIMRESKSTVVKLTPSHLMLIKNKDNRNSSVRRFIVGGEDLKVSLSKEISESFAGNIEILNEYGPTEAVVGCMLYQYNKDKEYGVSVPIGHPASNVYIYLLDSKLNLVPDGFEGEIYISGDCVSRGYLNSEQITKERFINNPFVPNKRMYKTGDLARYLKDGNIEYIGRVDNQVKILGHRIEIGEIEYCLLEQEAVKDAVVVVKENEIGTKSLAAYIVKRKEVEKEEIKKCLMNFLPQYMIPSLYVFIDSIPLTLNGKIDYRKLPEPVINQREFIAANTEAEKAFISILKEIINISEISMNDNYYQLGGDSIKAIQISSRLANEGLEIKVKDILKYDTIQEITDCIILCNKLMNFDPDSVKGKIQGTPITRWFFEQHFLNQSHYNQYIVLEYQGNQEHNIIEAAIKELIAHHDILRISYNREDGLFYNESLNETQFKLEYIDLYNMQYEEQYAHIYDYNSKIQFDLQNDFLFFVTLFELGNRTQVLLFTAHHLIVDGISWRIILEDFFNAVQALKSNKDVELPKKTHSYKIWADSLFKYSKNSFDKQFHYWDEIDERYDNYLSEFIKVEEYGVGNISINIEQELVEELSKKAKEIYNLSLNDILIISLVISLRNLTNKEDIFIELERHGRETITEDIDVSRTVGWFTSIFLSYFHVSDTNLNSCIKAVKEQLNEIPNKGFDYSILKYLMDKLHKRIKPCVRFNYLGDFNHIYENKNVNIRNIQFGLDSDFKNHLSAMISIDALIVMDGLKMEFTYDKSVFNQSTIQQLADSYTEMIKEINMECREKNMIEITPSDFDITGVSLDDWDKLFNNK